MASSTMNELRTGCRRGNVAALDALLYHCADGVYAMALTAVDDEATAQELVREVWRRQLATLKGLRFEADAVAWFPPGTDLQPRLGDAEADGEGDLVEIAGVRYRVLATRDPAGRSRYLEAVLKQEK